MATLFDRLYKNPNLYTEFEEYVFGKKRKNLRERYKNSLLDVPVILWDDEYLEKKKSKKFLKIVQNVSDYLLFNGSTVYDDNPNTPNMYDAMRGIIDPKDYEAAEYTFGEKGSSPIRDNHFFYTSREATIGQAVAMPFVFGAKNISNEYSKTIIKKNADTASAYLIDLAIQGISEQYPQFSDFATGIANKDMTESELIEVLNSQEYLEKIIIDLLLDIKNRGHFASLIKNSWDDKFAINSQFAIVEEINGDVIPRDIRPGQVSWISSKKIETFEDPSVIAVGVTDHLSITEMLNKYGSRFEFLEGGKGLLSTIKDIIDRKEVSYDPGRLNFYDNAKSVTYNLAEAKMSELMSYDKLDNIIKVNWANDIFYPKNKGPLGISTTILEHKFYFNMLQNKRFAIEINGKKPSKEMVERWRTSDFDRSLIAKFTELKSGEKADGRYIINRPVKKLFEATRLGHNTLIDVGEYKYKSSDDRTSGFPVVAQISRDKSFTLIGYNYAYWSNIIFNRIEDIINQVGLSGIILIDENQLTGHGTEMDFLYNAKKSGIGLFNSSRVNNSNQNMAAKHLSFTELGPQAAEVENLLSTVGLFKVLYDRQVGSAPETLGITEKYQGKGVTQMAIQNQGALKQNKFYEHYQFMNQVLQRTGDIVKQVNAYDGTKTVLVDNNEKKFLKLVKEIGLWQYNIFLENGADIKRKKDIIDQMAMQMAPSGGVDFLEPLMDILLTENAEEAREIFKRTKSILSTLAQQKADKDREAMVTKAQFDAEAASMPLKVEKLRGKNAMDLQRMKESDLAKRDDNKGLRDDLKEINDRERMILQSEINKDESSQQNIGQDVN